MCVPVVNWCKKNFVLDFGGFRNVSVSFLTQNFFKFRVCKTTIISKGSTWEYLQCSLYCLNSFLSAQHFPPSPHPPFQVVMGSWPGNGFKSFRMWGVNCKKPDAEISCFSFGPLLHLTLLGLDERVGRVRKEPLTPSSSSATRPGPASWSRYIVLF